MRLPGRGRSVLVVDRAHHPSGAVPTVVVVEAVAPVQYDGLGPAGVGEFVAGEDLPLQAREERLRGGVVEALSGPTPPINCRIPICRHNPVKLFAV
jgi:hypothetical protein